MKRVLWLLAAGALGLLAYALVPHAQTVSPEPEALVPTASVQRRSLSSQIKMEGSLGYAGEYSVVNHREGYFTWLPADEVVAPGEVLYRVGTLPVVLLRGSIPAWRDLSPGTSGSDVEQLNNALVELGFLDRVPQPEVYGRATEAAVQALQTGIGAEPSGALPLGNAVFFPSPLRIVSVLPVPGARADANSVVIRATSTSRRVFVRVSASQLGRIKVGDEVTVTLNLGSDLRVVKGRVSRISTSAAPGTGDIPLFPVEAVPESSLGSIDLMPVQVGFTDASVQDALVVPVTALLSTADRGPVVEVVGSRGSRTLVPVQLGVFSDAEGLVQVTAEGLNEGDKVVVPAL